MCWLIRANSTSLRARMRDEWGLPQLRQCTLTDIGSNGA